MSRLISNIECIKWIPALRSANIDIFDTQAEVIERDCFMDCLGLELYGKMMLAKTEIPISTCHWSNGEVYNLDDIVEFDTVYYKSLSANNTSNMISANWIAVPYFTNADYNALWASGMAVWLSNSIWKACLPYQTYMTGGKGPVKHYEDSGQRTIDTKEYYTLIRSIENSINTAKRVMISFAKSKGFIKENSCGVQGEDCIDEQYNSRVAWFE